MPKRPGNDEINVIFEMFEASVAGELYDPDRWGAFYTPPGMSRTDGSTQTAVTPTPPVVTKPTVVSDKPAEAEVPKEETTTEDTENKGEKPSAAQILKLIRDRKAQA
jgi:hypothetical protein